MINFEREKNGYNRHQIDSYLQKVREQYRAMYEEYKKLLAYAKELKQENGVLRSELIALQEDQKRFAMSSQEKTALIAEAVRQSELTAKRILQNAGVDSQQTVFSDVSKTKIPVMTPINSTGAARAAEPKVAAYQKEPIDVWSAEHKPREGLSVASNQTVSRRQAAPRTSMPAEQLKDRQKRKEELDKILAQLYAENISKKAGER